MIRKGIEAAVAGFMETYKETNKKDRVQMFDTPSILPDLFVDLYSESDGRVRYCPFYDYIEILGAKSRVYKRLFKKYGR